MSKSFTLSKMSLKDIVIAVLVLYITYKLGASCGFEPLPCKDPSSHVVESAGIEPARHALVVVTPDVCRLTPQI